MYSMSSFDIKIHATRIHISRRFICHISFPSVLFLGLSQTTPYVDHCYLNITGLVPNAAFSVLCHDGNSFRSLLKESGMIWPGIFNVFIKCGIIWYYFWKNPQMQTICKFRVAAVIISSHTMLCHQSKTWNSSNCHKLLWHLWPDPLAQMEHVRDTAWYWREVFWALPS